LKNSWKLIDFTKETSHLDPSTSSCSEEDVERANQSLLRMKSNPSYLPHDDYEEMLNLAAYYIEQKPSVKFSFRRPGTQHRARWMPSCIYSLKMLLLQEQLDIEPADLEKLKSFGEFVAVIYAPLWFQFPLASEAAYNDLLFYKKMLECQTMPVLGDISARAIQALNRHLWYLTEELIPFALCSQQLAPEVKEVMARKLFQLYRENQHAMFPSQKPAFPHITRLTQISDLVGERFVLVLLKV